MLGFSYLFSLSFQHFISLSLLIFVLGLQLFLNSNNKQNFFKGLWLQVVGLVGVALSFLWLSPSYEIWFLFFVFSLILLLIWFARTHIEITFTPNTLSPMYLIAVFFILEWVFWRNNYVFTSFDSFSAYRASQSFFY